MPLRATTLAAAAIAALSSLAGAAALASPLQVLPVDDPLQAELRVLETFSYDSLTGQWPRARYGGLLGTRPYRLGQLLVAPPSPESLDPVRRISAIRIWRALARDLGEGGPGASTARLFDTGPAVAWPGRLQISAGIEGGGDVERGVDPHFASGSGLHLRGGVELDRWLFYSHVVVGRIEGAQAFADPIAPNSDLVAHTEETYVTYAGAAGWDLQFGRSRWAWGPGDEGSLILSASAPAITGLAFGARLPALRLRASVLNATLAAAAGEQLAAHRLEWQATESLTLGATETARYRSSGWSPLYAVGVLPYVLAQRLGVEDEPDSSAALRNNVLLGGDAAWRIADGTRVYGELLIDDLHAKSATTPNKLAFQVGWDGAGAIGRSRVTWNGEYTRVSRFVYTSFFGRTHAAHGEPLGYLTGPDARRIRVRMAWDPSPDWQLFARAARTDHGQNALDEPFVPGAGMDAGHTFDFEGVVERTREADLGVRWWPASGVDLAVSAGWSWVDDAGHVAGATHDAPRAALVVRLTR